MKAVLTNLALGTQTWMSSFKKILAPVCCLVYYFVLFLWFLLLLWFWALCHFSLVPFLAFWPHLSKLRASCELVMSLNNIKMPSTQEPQESEHLSLRGCRSSFTRRRARQRTHRNLERSDHSSLWGLLVCWLCARWHFSLRRESETDSTVASEQNKRLVLILLLKGWKQFWVYRLILLSWLRTCLP